MNTNTNAAAKIFARRDSATALLRKMGVAQPEYSLFIEPMSGGRFACQVAKAEMHLKGGEAMGAGKPTVEPKKAAAKKSPAKKAKTEKKVKAAARTVSSVARDLIVAGKSNSEVWDVIKAEFKLDDSRKSYPAWYRSDCKRKKLIK